jgi:FlaA1/EpsC-like NDP-sugar epimerase
MEEINNLLSRRSLFTNGDGLREKIQDRVILVTGAGGSIGSELCRQIVPYKPSHLILLGHGEHGIFTVASDLKARDPHLSISRVIANVQDRKRIENIFVDLPACQDP